MGDNLANQMLEDLKQANVCIQTGRPCGFPCFDGCPKHKDND